MGESSPLVSIIIATYNWSSVLRCAIESVRRQTFEDFELLVIGDGCTDDSGKVAGSFQDPRIRWRNLEKNNGSQSMPNNAGLEMARGKYIAYHGHDDVWHPKHLAGLVEAMEESLADLAYSVAVMIGPAGSGVRIVTGMSDSGKYEPEMFLPPTSIMHRRDAAEAVGSWRDYRELTIPPDREFVGRMWHHRRKFAGAGALTAFKLNSAWRRNSYREKPCHEQVEYLRRMKAEPDFIERELMAITRAYVLGKTQSPVMVKLPEDPAKVPPGYLVEQWRRIRGLEPKEVGELKKVGAVKKGRRRIKKMLQSVAKRLGD